MRTAERQSTYSLRVVLLMLPLALLLGCERDAFEIVRQPLEMAAERGDLAEVERLIAAGADIDGSDGTFNPLDQAVSYRVGIDVVRALLDAGANPDGRSRGANWCWAMPLTSALHTGQLDVSRLLLDSGAYFDTQCSNMALGFLAPPIIDLLLERGLNTQATDELGRNALHALMREQHPSTLPRAEGVQYLVKIGVPLNVPDFEGKTPLAYWREPRPFETFKLQRWLWSAVFGEPAYLERARKQRAEVSEMLTAAGATL